MDPRLNRSLTGRLSGPLKKNIFITCNTALSSPSYIQSRRNGAAAPALSDIDTHYGQDRSCSDIQDLCKEAVQYGSAYHCVCPRCRRDHAGDHDTLSDRAPRLDCEQKKYAWLRSTCVRLSIDWLRKTRKLVPIDSSVADIPDEETVADDGPDWQKMGADTVKDVMSAMESLAPGYRTVLVLRLIEGYEYQEIARMMHLSESGVRSQYMRARRRLADAVRKMLDI